MRPLLDSYKPALKYLAVLLTVWLTSGSEYQYLIIACELIFLPLLDKNWQWSAIRIQRANLVLYILTIVAIVVILYLQPGSKSTEYFVTTTVFAAFPEEWFFRSYLQTRIGSGLKANVIASVAFSFLHIFRLGWIHSILVFFPSLLYGWIYQKKNDIALIVLLHALSNLFYFVFLDKILTGITS